VRFMAACPGQDTGNLRWRAWSVVMCADETREEAGAGRGKQDNGRGEEREQEALTFLSTRTGGKLTGERRNSFECKMTQSWSQNKPVTHRQLLAVRKWAGCTG